MVRARLRFNTFAALLSSLSFVACAAASFAGAAQTQPTAAAAGRSPAVSSSTDQTVTIVALGPRSLRDAVGILSSELGQAITYEDPSYFGTVLTEQIVPAGPKKPRDHRIDVTFTVSPSLTPQVGALMLVNNYGLVDGNVAFKVVTSVVDPAVVHVVPVASIAETGEPEINPPMLDTLEPVSASDTLGTVVANLTRTIGAKYKIDTFDIVPPTLANLGAKLAVSGNSLTARDLLDQILLASPIVSGAETWGFAHDPNPNIAKITFQPVSPNPLPGVSSVTVMNIEEPRPLAAAVRIIARRTPGTLIYEDPVYGAHSTVFRDLAGTALSPHTGVLNYAYDNSTHLDPQLSGCVSANNTQLPIFQFVDADLSGASYVYPSEYEDPGLPSNQLPLVALLNKPLAPLSFRGAPQQVLAQIGGAAANGATVSTGNVAAIDSPVGVILASKTPLTGAQWLQALANALGKQLSFMLLYDPQTKAYTVSVYSNS